MTTVLVLAGGISDEREISLRSGAAVAAALRRSGYRVREFDPIKGIAEKDVRGCEVIFPVLHGKGGEDGSLQAQLDEFGVPYVGTGAAASALCFDKWRYKQMLDQHDLPNPTGMLVDEIGFQQSSLSKQPFVLKRLGGGSSIDILIVREVTPQLDKDIVHELFERQPNMLLEELINGLEITVSILGGLCLPVIEIIPPPSGEFDYQNKYNGQSQELCPPEHVTQAVQAKAQKLSLVIHELAGCGDFSRTDIMVGPNGELYVLETNTIPGMTDQSLFPKAALTAGITMEQLVDQLVRLALGH